MNLIKEHAQHLLYINLILKILINFLKNKLKL